MPPGTEGRPAGVAFHGADLFADVDFARRKNSSACGGEDPPRNTWMKRSGDLRFLRDVYSGIARDVERVTVVGYRCGTRADRLDLHRVGLPRDRVTRNV